MNLIELMTPQAILHQYNGCQFTQLQGLLYERFVEAMNDNRTLLIPSRTLPRCSGKTMVLQKLSSEFGLPVLRGSDVFFYNDRGDDIRTRISDFRGTQITHVLIDEPTAFYQADAKRAFGLPCIGYRNFEIDRQPYLSRVDTEAIQIEAMQLRERGGIYEHGREY